MGVGIVSYGTDLPETATEEEVLEVVEKYNADPRVHGILVQLPLPKHINEKDLDCDFHREGRGWFPPREYWQACHARQKPLLCSLHAQGQYGASRANEHSH